MADYHMRRSDKAITDPAELEAILRGQSLVTLSMCTGGEPYLVTVDYGYDPQARCIYFHCAREGKKVDILRANPLVWGQVLDDRGYMRGECDHAYRSVQFRGRVELLSDPDEMRRGLEVMFDALEPDMDPAERKAHVEGSISKALVGRVTVEGLTGKRNLPAGSAD